MFHRFLLLAAANLHHHQLHVLAAYSHLSTHAGLILLHLQTWMAHTERAKARLWEEQYVDYGWEVPDSCVTMLLGLVYCLIQPLMTPIALLYFIVNSCLYKYQLIYVHKPQFESGGLVRYFLE